MLVCVFMAMAVLMGVFVLMGVSMLVIVLVCVTRVLEGRYQLLAVLMGLLPLIVAPAKPGELGEGHFALVYAGALEQSVDHLLLESGRLDHPHRVLVLQIGAPRLLRIGIVLRERVEARLHALAVEPEAL